MQRPNSKNTRQANAEERRFHGWLKEHDCHWCKRSGPSIVDHARGSTFKHNKVLIGHWFCIPTCVECDTQKTIHGKRLGNESWAWINLINEYGFIQKDIPMEVYCAIQEFNR